MPFGVVCPQRGRLPLPRRAAAADRMRRHGVYHAPTTVATFAAAVTAAHSHLVEQVQRLLRGSPASARCHHRRIRHYVGRRIARHRAEETRRLFPLAGAGERAEGRVVRDGGGAGAELWHLRQQVRGQLPLPAPAARSDELVQRPQLRRHSCLPQLLEQRHRRLELRRPRASDQGVAVCRTVCRHAAPAHRIEQTSCAAPVRHLRRRLHHRPPLSGTPTEAAGAIESCIHIHPGARTDSGTHGAERKFASVRPAAAGTAPSASAAPAASRPAATNSPASSTSAGP
mmetsp:Transcript_50373/g.162647  ORF Transcript_50373/g.162647 Transcript_50373/m.162647 type:complete len:285 (+) Transcript_50373:1498-2352(+)